VAVTSSLLNPRYDYEVNVGGTVNVLEAIRSASNPPSLVFTSTNKVYGELLGLDLKRARTRYETALPEMRLGVNEACPLNFHSPYGCSKGAADQYVLDYARTFHIKAAVFRMSCIYGPHQMGTEDQGWIAHFLRQTLKDHPITICGDGLQVRDILFVDDLVDAFLLAQANIVKISGEAFNIGGGCTHTISLVELLSAIEKLDRRKPRTKTDDWRQGDQRYYVSDTRKFGSVTGWSPRVTVQEGIQRLYHWLTEEYASCSDIEVGGEHAVFAH
jgi:CDP-paratose 2-epimerase